MVRKHNMLHETIVRDIFDVVKGLKNEDEVQRIVNFNNKNSFKSINTRSEALTLVFPCIASRNCSYESAAMTVKAIEQKHVSLLTMLFAAIQVTDANDAFEYLKRFHTNLDAKQISVDSFLDAMDGFVESHIVKNQLDEVQIMEAYETIKADMKANMNCYFEFTDISESSLGDYKVYTYGNEKDIRNMNPIIDIMTENDNIIEKDYDSVPPYQLTNLTNDELFGQHVNIAGAGQDEGKVSIEQLARDLFNYELTPGEITDTFDLFKQCYRSSEEKRYDVEDYETTMDAYCEAYIQKSIVPLQEKLKFNTDIPVYQIPDNLAQALVNSNMNANDILSIHNTMHNANLNATRQADTRTTAINNDRNARLQRGEMERQFNIKMAYQQQRDAIDDERREREYQHQIAKDNENLRLQRQKNSMEMQKLLMSVNQNRLVDQDVKKANDLQPTLMVVNFVRKADTEREYPVMSSFVIGVKAKLYVVDGSDIFNRFKIKSNDKNLLLNLVKVGTREISFFKDFLFAIDNAKLDAVSQSRRGSSSKFWKVLERRALKSKMRRSLNMINDATAITSIIVTADEVEFFKKTQYIDLEVPKVMNRIMDAYNLLNFVILDDNTEVAKFLTDTGDDVYELVTYDHLQKEQRDNTKKILNLMSKMR